MAMADKTPVRRDAMGNLPKEQPEEGALPPYSQAAEQREKAPAGEMITEGEFPVKPLDDDGLPMKLNGFTPRGTNPPMPEAGSSDGFPEAPEGGLTKG